MAQTLTSANTSINSTKLPAVYGKANLTASLVMDYGCGRYTDHIRKHVNDLHKTYLPFDPYNQPEERNAVTASLVINAMYARFPVDVICSNVLNVIDDEDTVRKVARQVEEIVTCSGGTGYVTVYEGDRSGTGRQTGADQYQRNETLRSYLRFFRNATIRNGMIIVEGKRSA